MVAMTPSDFWGFWDATLPGGVTVNSSDVPTQWVDISGNGRNHALSGTTTFSDGYLQNNGSWAFRTSGVLPDNGAGPTAADWAISVYVAWGSDWGSASVNYPSNHASYPRIVGGAAAYNGTYVFQVHNGTSHVQLNSLGHLENVFYPLTYFRLGDRMGLRSHGVTQFTAPSGTGFPYAATYWQLLSGRYRASRASVYWGAVNESILDSMDRLMETGEDVPPKSGPILSSPHLINHLDRNQLFHSPHLVGRLS